MSHTLPRIGRQRESSEGVTSNSKFQVGVRDGLIIVTDPATRFYAIYSKSPNRPRLILERRRPIIDHKIVARSRKAANAKARELGWIG